MQLIDIQQCLTSSQQTRTAVLQLVFNLLLIDRLLTNMARRMNIKLVTPYRPHVLEEMWTLAFGSDVPGAHAMGRQNGIITQDTLTAETGKKPLHVLFQ
jgi:hypothetical protein